ncbi:tetratricopeptide repeat protein [Scytonema sp. PCC 10023]|uniref:tetratricopeptide repeat protein n=1 Tax=Scytonema sp. PCC 10023 TaxID=1680591 RepID=UPI0039C6D742
MLFNNKKQILFVLTLLITIGLSGCGIKFAKQMVANDPSRIYSETTHHTAPLFKNLGNHHHPISTNSKLAQRYFDQGLTLAYGFNHAEAARSFKEAASLDPNCAMCYWGIALVKGPNINAPMEKEAVPETVQAMKKAIGLSKNASEKEKAYIQALAKRYSLQPDENRKPLDTAYVNAMREVQKRYPEDLDAATLFAEAFMDTMPWNYWSKDGKPNPGTTELLTVLESVLKRNPNHPGANHLYIHAVESSPNPERGIASADRLGELVPGAGHLVHMPAHIYIRVGRYHDAVVANQRAIAVDQDYITQCHAQGIYPLGYMPHNHHFLMAGAMMGGDSEVAIQAARHTAEMADQKKMRELGYGTLQHYYAMPLYALTRFGKWDEILKEPAPVADLKYPNGVWHYTRGMAFAAKGELKQAAEELKQLKAIAADPAIKKVTVWDINTTSQLLQMASEVLAGEIAAQQSDYTKAIAHLKTAVTLEDNLKYDEPATWYSPVRQSLGALLLKTNRGAEAETVYKEDLERYPENGWSLFGLVQSLRQQGKTREALTVQERFEQAWKYADVKLIASRF